MFVQQTKDRFNLLLLDEGEYFFEDLAAAYFPVSEVEDECWNRYQETVSCNREMVYATYLTIMLQKS